MAEHIDAGKLDKPAQVLELKETGAGVWEWTPVRRAWASITFQPKTNLFSKVGIGARDAAVVVRRQPLTLHNALCLGEQHLFLTSITDRGRALFRQELSRLRLCVGDGEREERAAENLLPGGREEDPS